MASTNTRVMGPGRTTRPCGRVGFVLSTDGLSYTFRTVSFDFLRAAW